VTFTVDTPVIYDKFPNSRRMRDGAWAKRNYFRLAENEIRILT